MTQLSFDVGNCVSRPLFVPGYYIGKTRPTQDSPEVKEKVINEIVPELSRWLGEEINEDILDVLYKVVDSYKDPYDIAKGLDNYYHWDSNKKLIDIFDNMNFYKFHTKAVEAWIRDNNIKPQYKKTDIIDITIKNPKYTGKAEILDINENGKYVLHIAELGHVKTGIGTHGILVDWEKIDL